MKYKVNYRLLSKREKMTSVVKDVQRREPLFTIGDNVK